MKLTLKQWNLIESILKEKKSALLAGYKLVEGTSETSAQIRRDLEREANEIHKILLAFEYQEF